MPRGTTRSIPSREAWGDLESDLEVKSGYEHFGGKSVEAAAPLVAENPINAAAELRASPAEVFNYYIFAFVDNLMSPNSRDASDMASVFLRLLRDRIVDKSEDLAPAMAELWPAVVAISTRQEFYDADEDVYGSFRDIAHEIEKAWRTGIVE